MKSTKYFLVILLLLTLVCCSRLEDKAESNKVELNRAAPAMGLAMNEVHEYQPDVAVQFGKQTIKSASLTLKVDDFLKAQNEIRKFVDQSNGFIFRNEQRGELESKLSGTMVLKIPTEKYSDALAFLRNLGTVFELGEKAEEISDRMVDLETRLKNSRTLELRIREILSSQTGNLEQIVQAERELARVRSEIEEMSGRLRNMKNRVQYATFTIHLFVSGSKDVETRSWYGPLLQDLRDLGFVVAGSIGALLTVIVAVIPWILLFVFLRRLYRKLRKSK